MSHNADFCQNKDVANSNLHNLQLICSSICDVAVYHVKLNKKVLGEGQDMIHDIRKYINYHKGMNNLTRKLSILEDLM